MLMNYYRHIDRSKVQFDFIVNKKKPGDYDDEIRRLGGHIYQSPCLLYTSRLLRRHQEPQPGLRQLRLRVQGVPRERSGQAGLPAERLSLIHI